MLHLLASAVLAAAPLTGAHLSWDGRRAAAELQVSAPVSLADVQADLAGRHLQLRVRGATLPQPARTFGNGAGALQARRDAAGVTVDAELGGRLACAGPVLLELISGGVRASVACSRGGTARQPALPQPKLEVAPSPPPARVEAPAPVAPVARAATPQAPLPPHAEAPAHAPVPPPHASLPALPAEAPLPWGLPLLALLALAGLAFGLKRRRAAHGAVQVVETASLGPKRALLLVKLGDEVLLLGSSEGGIHLLATRPNSVLPAAAPTAPQTASWFERLKLRAGVPSSFDALLAEDTADQELRQKLAAGLSGTVAP